MPPEVRPHHQITRIEKLTASIGSVPSLIIHTAAFIGFFVASIAGVITWELMLLVLTTIVSLEAIYLAIFIQITVNRHTQSLREVEDDIDEIQEDVEELGEDVEDIQEDIEEISEDIDEIQEDFEELSEDEGANDTQIRKVEKKALDKAESLEKLSKDVARVLADLEALKKGK